MIEALSLEKRYGPIRAVDGIDFSVKPGEILGFLGPNGAGKSTTMKMVAGFVRPDGGTARIGGHDILEEPLQAKSLFGYLPETGPLYPEMTVSDFLRFSGELRGLRGKDLSTAVDRVYELCHLGTVRQQTLETLSKGYRQRVGLAQAVLHDPPYLILDEPTDGLDPNQKSEVRKLIAGMARDKAIILSTHILEEVEAMCTRVLIINHGRIVADASPRSLKERHPDYNAIRVTADAETLAKVAAWARENALADTKENGSLVLRPKKEKGGQPGGPFLAAAAKHGWKIERVDSLPLHLDAVFAKLTGNTLN
ncbi:MAG: ABC transporter ATP-binding protein [Opitutales bacterium]|nr:ABC transporter ATP-binding protein [Opitutales bacterium]